MDISGSLEEKEENVEDGFSLPLQTLEIFLNWSRPTSGKQIPDINYSEENN